MCELNEQTHLQTSSRPSTTPGNYPKFVINKSDKKRLYKQDKVGVYIVLGLVLSRCEHSQQRRTSHRGRTGEGDFIGEFFKFFSGSSLLLFSPLAGTRCNFSLSRQNLRATRRRRSIACANIWRVAGNSSFTCFLSIHLCRT